MEAKDALLPRQISCLEADLPVCQKEICKVAGATLFGGTLPGSADGDTPGYDVLIDLVSQLSGKVEEAERFPVVLPPDTLAGVGIAVEVVELFWAEKAVEPGMYSAFLASVCNYAPPVDGNDSLDGFREF